MSPLMLTPKNIIALSFECPGCGDVNKVWGFKVFEDLVCGSCCRFVGRIKIK